MEFEKDDLEVFLFPITMDEIGGQPRSKTPAEQRVLLERGDYLTTKARISLLYHGKLDLQGPEASLLVVDFRFIRSKQGERFVSAIMKLNFRDTEGDKSKDPEVYRMAPEDNFSIKPGKETWKITQTANAQINAGITPAGGNIGGAVQREGEKNTDHCILLTGITLIGAGGFKENSVKWTLEEDPVKHDGIPAVLRTSVILRRTPHRSFTIDVEVQTEANKRGKLRAFLGGKEHSVPLEDIEVNADEADHIIEGYDLELSNFKDTTLWDKLNKVKLQEDLVLTSNAKLMARE